MGLAEETCADSYMLVAIRHDGETRGIRILASNWIHDAIELAGSALIAGLAEAAPPTASLLPRCIRASEAPAMPGVMTGEQARLLDVLGQREIYPLRLSVGLQRYFLLLSSEAAGQIAEERLVAVRMRCCYALSEMQPLLLTSSARDPLSERERECLAWVAEGKTTDEVALILGVSANTINSYVTHAIQKLGAENRARAVATAIRSGII